MVLLEVVESMDFFGFNVFDYPVFTCLFVFIQKQNEKDFE